MVRRHTDQTPMLHSRPAGRTPGARYGRAVAGVCAALLLGACTGRAPDAVRAQYGPPSLAVPGLGARQCSYLRPERLESALDLIHVGFRGNAALWGYGGDPAAQAIFSIRYDDEGELEWILPVEATVPAERLASLDRVLRASVGQQGPARWGFRLRVRGDGRGVEALPSVLCPVRLAHFNPSTGRVWGTSQEMAEASRVRGRRFDVEVAVDPQGRVVGVRLPQGTGSRAVDQGAIDVVRTASFHPELHDGFGINSTYMLPLRFGRRH